jgi:probable HAF family extracellular repeat protein
MPFRKAVLSLAVLLLASAPLALAQGTYTQIDVPGGFDTTVQAVNSAGDLAGWYQDASASIKGFLLQNGAYTTINVQAAYTSQVVGMNDSDQLVVDTTGDSYASFLYDSQTKTFTFIYCTGVWALYTFASAINNEGTVVGYTVGATGYGFELPTSSAQCKRIGGPGGGIPKLIGIDTGGDLLMSVYHSGSYAYYLLHGGKYRELTIPNAPSAVVAGINPAGTALVGNYQPSSGTYVGFLYQNKVLTTLEFPGAVGTGATGVNAAGEVVGNFGDSSGNGHGFTWTPPADAAKK